MVMRMKIRKDFVTNSSSSSFLITNKSDKTMDAKDVILALIAKVLEDAEDRFILEPGQSLRYECGDSDSDGAFENFIHNGFNGWGISHKYGNGNAEVTFLESHH